MVAQGDGGGSAELAQLDAWLDAQQEAPTARLKAKSDPDATTHKLREKTGETITHATLAALNMPLSDEAPSSIHRLPTFDVGARDGELSVVRLIGRGGMAEVQLAKQRALQRDVAIKRVRSDKDSSIAASSLLREARIIGRLEHPNIVPVYMLGQDEDGLPIIVMKRVEGLRWRDLINDTTPERWQTTNLWSHEPMMRQLEVLLEVCNAVHFAHSLGILHRDIKPSNVMLGRFGEVYLLDWGVACRVGTGAFAHAPPGKPYLPLGTPAFMAPEMADTNGVLDERTDVYQLGASLHEALLRMPRHPQTDLVEVLRSVMLSDPYDYPPEVPAQLAAICNKAMAQDPNDRFPSVHAMREAIIEFMGRRGSLRLLDEAEARMGALLATIQAHRSKPHRKAGETQLVSIRKLFTECRFAFKQALRDWPDSAVAKEGLHTCIEAMARHELDRGEVAAAAALLEELRVPGAELADAIASARHTEQAKIRDLDELREDLSIHVSVRQRAVLSGVLGATVLAIGALFVPFGGSPVLERSNGSIMLAYGLFGIVFAIVIASGRHDLLKNTANRRVAATVTGAVLGMFATRGLATLNGADMVYAGSIDLLVCGVATGMAGVTIDRGLGALAGIYLLGAMVLQRLPEGAATTLGFIGTQTAALLGAAVLWKLRSRDVAP